MEVEHERRRSLTHILTCKHREDTFMRRQGGEETEEPKKGVWWQLVEVSGRWLDTHTQHIYIRTLLILHNERVHFREQVDVMTLQERNQEVVFRHTLTAGRSVWFLCCNIPAVTANHTNAKLHRWKYEVVSHCVLLHPNSYHASPNSLWYAVWNVNTRQY